MPTPSSAGDQRARRPGAAARFAPVGWGVLVLAGFTAFVWTMCARDGAIRDAGVTFLSTLRRGDVDGAYAQLSGERRAVLSREDFAALTRHPAFTAHDDASVGTLEPSHPGFCTLGGLDVGGRDWNLQLFYLEEGGSYRVHSFAIQPPATVQLGVLLPECGLHQGTFAGYRGPAIEESTLPTATR